MKKTALVILVLAVVAGGCKARHGNAQNSQKTETMAPAAPATTPETSDPMTQTVDVEDSRSVAEGGVDTMASDTASAAKAKTGAAASSRKTPVSQSRPPGRTQ